MWLASTYRLLMWGTPTTNGCEQDSGGVPATLSLACPARFPRSHRWARVHPCPVIHSLSSYSSEVMAPCHPHLGWRGLVGGGVATPAPTSLNEGRGEGDAGAAVFALASSSSASGDDVAVVAVVVIHGDDVAGSVVNSGGCCRPQGELW